MPASRRRRIRELSPDPAVAARQARDLCLRLLTDRARTRHELEDVLLAEELPPDVVVSVLDRLEDLQLIDDAAYAEAFVRSRQRAGVAKRSVSRELRVKGIAEDEAEAALSTIDADQERETALLLATRRARRSAGLAPEVRRRRLYGFLARRGYPAEVVSSVVAEVFAGEGESVDEHLSGSADPYLEASS
jgi:regulatory protein